MFFIVRKSSLLALCVMLTSCFSTEQVIKKDSDSIDLSALEKYGKRVEKYDFVPHRIVLETSGDGGSYDSTIGNKATNIYLSLQASCKNAGGMFDHKIAAFHTVNTAFSKMFLYKIGNSSNERVKSGYRCALPGKGVIEVTVTSPDKYDRFVVIQDNDDVNATKLLTAQMEEEVKNMLLSSIDDWQRTSEALRNSLAPGSTVYFVLKAPSRQGMSVRWLAQEGMVIEVKAPLAFIQFQNDKQWIKTEELNAKVPDVLFCDNKEMTNAVGGLYSVERYKDSCFVK
jgi:hypothetical protein